MKQEEANLTGHPLSQSLRTGKTATLDRAMTTIIALAVAVAVAESAVHHSVLARPADRLAVVQNIPPIPLIRVGVPGQGRRCLHHLIRPHFHPHHLPPPKDLMIGNIAVMVEDDTAVEAEVVVEIETTRGRGGHHLIAITRGGDITTTTITVIIMGEIDTMQEIIEVEVEVEEGGKRMRESVIGRVLNHLIHRMTGGKGGGMERIVVTARVVKMIDIMKSNEMYLLHLAFLETDKVKIERTSWRTSR